MLYQLSYRAARCSRGPDSNREPSGWQPCSSSGIRRQIELVGRAPWPAADPLVGSNISKAAATSV